MTGPAKFAWIICALACGCALAGRAQAAPRDAIANLPSINTDISAVTSASNNSGRLTHSEDFTAAWDIDPKLPSINLGPAATLTWQAHFRLELKETENNINGERGGWRSETPWMKFTIGTGNLTATHFFSQSDSYSPLPTYERAWDGGNRTETVLAWAPPNGLPIVRLTRSTSRTYHLNGTIPLTMSEREHTGVYSTYTRENQYARLWYEANTSLDRWQGLLDPNSSASRNFSTTVNSNALLKLGDMGNLVTSISMSDSSNSKQKDLNDSVDRTLSYSSSIAGDVKNFPLKYGVSYSGVTVAYSYGATYMRSDRKISFDYTMPPLRRASTSFQYSNEYSDESGDANSIPVANSTETQTFKWIPQFNPLTRGELAYSLQNKTSVADSTRTSEQRGIAGSLSYSIPKRKGSVILSYNNYDVSDPRTATRTTGSSYGISNSNQLGNQSSIGFIYSHANYDAYYGSNGVSNGNENSNASVSYNLWLAGNFSVSSTWQQSFQRTYQSGRDIDQTDANQSIDCTFTYYPIPDWTYTFKINGRDSASFKPDTNLRSYSSGDMITLTINHQF
jgi:hypothetical protein